MSAGRMWRTLERLANCIGIIAALAGPRTRRRVVGERSGNLLLNYLDHLSHEVWASTILFRKQHHPP